MAQGEDDRIWHWLVADGRPTTGDEWDLVAGLSSGTLAAGTLVWHRGWAEWLPANRVKELSTAVPAQHRKPLVEPKLDPSASVPPPPPVAVPPAKPGQLIPKAPPSPPQAPGFKPISAERAQLKPIGPVAVPPKPATKAEAEAVLKKPNVQPLVPETPLPTPSSFGVLSPKGSSAPPPPTRGRDAMPTITEEEGSSSTATLRPPGAVPPPPRGVPTKPVIALTSPLPREPEAKPTILTPIPVPLPPPLAAAERSSPNVAERSSPAVAAPPPTVPPAQSSSPVAALPEPRPQSAPELKAAPRREGTVTDPALSALRKTRASLAWLATPRTKYALIGLSVSSVLLAALVVFLLIRRSDSSTHAAGTNANGTTAQNANSAACTLKHPAARFAPAIERSVPTYVASIKDTSMLAVGFAATTTRGIGMILDPLALEGKTTFDDEGKVPIRGVIPLVAHGKPGFTVDREDAKLRSARTVDAVPLFTVGVSDIGFARSNDGTITTIWPGHVADKITEPRVVTTEDGLHAIVYRSGGTSGKVLVGWLGEDGSAKTPLLPVPGAPRFSGTPFAASFGNHMMVVFAGRNDQNGPWRVHFSHAKSGQKPGHARELPGFGSGGGAIAPSVAGLADGRWLLQWTEGSLGRYQVRVQTLDSDLRPIGEPVLVSPKGASAGQGTIWAGGSPAVALFILTTAGRDELWGAALTCP